MRQIGHLKYEPEAHRFAAYLITCDIPAHAEADGDTWAIWVRDENDLETSKEALAHFQRSPGDERYAGVEKEAHRILEEQRRQQQDAHKNIVQMRGKWSQAGAPGQYARAPLTYLLIGISVAVSLWTDFGAKPNSNYFLFSIRQPTVTDINAAKLSQVFVDIKEGEVWRLVSPMFLHLSPMHLLFNMLWLFMLGRQIENRQSAILLLLLVLSVAVISNVAQAWTKDPAFGGMSGVVYGLLGYSWMKSRFDPQSGIMVGQSTVTIMMIWLVLCFTGAFGPVANAAHVGGLVSGVAIGSAMSTRAL
mgnify:CR=1 FL=1